MISYDMIKTKMTTKDIIPRKV